MEPTVASAPADGGTTPTQTPTPTADGVKVEEADPAIEAAIVSALPNMLKVSDLKTTTERRIRKQLEAEMGMKLSAYKKLIRDEVGKYLQDEAVRQQAEAAEAARHAADTGGETKKSGGYQAFLSPEMAAFVGKPREARTQVVKLLWAYIKEHNLQDPSNKRNIILDEELGKLFKAPMTMFSMNKQLSRHCKQDDRTGYVTEAATGSSKAKASKPKKPKKDAAGTSKGGVKKAKANGAKAKKGKKGADGEGGEKKKRAGGGGFGTVIILEPLKSFMGTGEAARTEVVKRIWAHIREHNCKDPTNGRNIILDATLSQFLTAPCDMFNMNRQISKYLQKKEKGKEKGKEETLASPAVQAVEASFL